MKLSQIFTILFLASLVLLVPISKQEHQHTLIPFETKTIIVNVQNTKLIVGSNRIDEVYFMGINYLNPEKSGSDIIQPTELFSGEDEPIYEIENRGFYEITITADESLITITITTEGIPDTTIIIISLIMLLAIGAQVQKQFSRSFDY
ncbi:MAG: hypothetical protein GPJ54_21815 [Candidatus Heimdallarchaeota archaeon]|nr:hypothetical protein [Candidatus Heimdallarchaeota archaeon]